MKKLCLMAVLLLAGCGNGDDSNPFPPTPAPEPTTDAFYAAVLALVASSPDDAEPGSIDNVAATAPEDSEPLPQ
jgi:hypothetical protein